jgi:hypothetical protein
MHRGADGLGGAANSRSVATAVVGCTPNSSTSNGVISDPPPTPVSPTSKPTPAPDGTSDLASRPQFRAVIVEEPDRRVKRDAF